jgi:hypothetical protein
MEWKLNNAVIRIEVSELFWSLLIESLHEKQASCFFLYCHEIIYKLYQQWQDTSLI